MMLRLRFIISLLFFGSFSALGSEGSIISPSLDQYLSSASDAYNKSSLKKIMNEEDYQDFIMNGIKSNNDHSQQSLGLEGEIHWINGTDKKECGNFKNHLTKKYSSVRYDNLCQQQSNSPFNTVTVFEKEKPELRLYFDELKSGTDAGSEPETKYDKLIDNTKSIAGLGVITVVIIYFLPKDVSNWDREDIKNNWRKKWFDNVSSGPVIDKDDPVLNYVGHPISGAIYHLVARHSGLNAWESFGYGVIMSTFFWEYGIEAIAEVPSIQDLFITPIFGSLLGEGLYQLELKIKANDGKLLNSDTFGDVISFMVNPVKTISGFVNDALNYELIKKSRGYFYSKPRTLNINDHNNIFIENEIGVGVEIKF